MDLVINRTEELKGVINAPPSKSYTHRSIIASSLSNDLSKLKNILISDDIHATIEACTKLGAIIESTEDGVNVYGSFPLKINDRIINCRESASTIRFLIPIAALANDGVLFTGGNSLRKRPVGELIDAIAKIGAICTSTGGYPPVNVSGGLIGGETSLVGDISSQFFSGLLFACPLARKDTKIFILTPLESKPYFYLTVEILKKHGIMINLSEKNNEILIPGNQKYTPYDHNIPGDYTSVAFILAAAAITGSRVRIKNLIKNQPGEEIINILLKMGVLLNIEENSLEVIGNCEVIKPIDFDAKDSPDLVPVCAVLACFAKGKSKIYNAKRLRLKESDRLSTLTSELRKFGAKIIETKDSLYIEGPLLSGATIESHNDHRIAMACTIAALNLKRETIIKNAECIKKSYPNFINDLKAIGAIVFAR